MDTNTILDIAQFVLAISICALVGKIIYDIDQLVLWGFEET